MSQAQDYYRTKMLHHMTEAEDAMVQMERQQRQVRRHYNDELLAQANVDPALRRKDKFLSTLAYEVKKALANDIPYQDQVGRRNTNIALATMYGTAALVMKEEQGA